MTAKLDVTIVCVDRNGELSRFEALAADDSVKSNQRQVSIPNDGNVVFMLRSECCLAADFVAPISKCDGEHVLAFCLEDWLPIEAESSIVSFINTSQSTLGIALDLDILENAIRNLNCDSAKLLLACPLSLLAAQQVVDSLSETSSLDAVVLQVGRDIELVVLDDKVPEMWFAGIDSMEELYHTVSCLLGGKRQLQHLATVGVADEICAGLERILACSLTEIPNDYSALAKQTVEKCLLRKSSPWCDLRDKTSVQREARSKLVVSKWILLVTSIALLVSICFGLSARARELKRIEQRLDARYASLFRNLFPRQAVPRAMKSRLEAEHQRLVAMTGRHASTELKHPMTIEVIGAFFKAFPKDIRCVVDELEVDGSHLEVIGTVRTHGDANVIAEQLAQVELDVTPPRTVQVNEDEVSFQIRAARVAEGDR